MSTQAAMPASPARPAFNADTTPRINLGGTDSLTNALVEGEQVIPAGPTPRCTTGSRCILTRRCGAANRAWWFC